MKVIHALMKWSHLEKKLSCANMNSSRSTTSSNLACFIALNQISPLHLQNENCVGGKHSKLRLTRLAPGNAVGEKLPLFAIGKSEKPRCFKYIKHLPYIGTAARRKAGWTAYYSRNVFVKLTDALTKKDKKLFYWLIIVQPTHPLITSYLLN